jgi:hypothetical protein
MESHDVELEIRKDGTIRVHIQGVKGKSCLEYARFLESIVGRTQSQELTAEYYEPDAKVQVDLKPRQELRRKD